ncbi:MAG: sigma-70 family RNA polymerase sigma factor [Methylomonas sp.]|nr:sigma-70 family RNA polymerase sigma factor [Methylomonas sp.]PPD22054.1 MAG: RNA polymerase subunit sigma-32 [Methylomonas sp.]PPD25246.1 MAG: RNA polymerase subunit sigma-32 [Methylomonas sp.]PPD35197.1 MAG: RNA polymerase subunit sigma-32 [Methylomonas sp.]PPD42458.1 MAG: RNA polymerase subunit sigma-32 [Methylomonas sp.]
MSDLTELASHDVASTLESEPVILASQVEYNRLNLLALLLNLPDVSARIASELHAILQHGADASEIILIKNAEPYRAQLQQFLTLYAGHSTHQTQASHTGMRENPVQARNPVQLHATASAESDVSAALIAILEKLHFLPVYLLTTSDALLKSPDRLTGVDAQSLHAIKQHRNKLNRLRQDMISSNTGLVAFVAHKYKTVTLSFEDLMQEGMVGLIKAVDRFDPDRGICFSTYAIYWIRQAISRLIVKQDKAVPLPVALAEKASAVFEAMRLCYLEKERWPTLDELKACCELTEQEIKTISSYYQATHSLDSRTDDEEDDIDELANMQQRQFALPLEQLIDRDLVDYVDKAVATLPEKQAAILTMRFGLKNNAEMTLQAVADHLHVTRERVRQIQNDALTKLKQQFGFDLMIFLEPNDT